MLKHADIWSAIDRLAGENGLTASGLARRAGLDPTTFNPSKRITREGKTRWPSTESLAKILVATGTDFMTFACLIDSRDDRAGLPLASLTHLKDGAGFSEAGHPEGTLWRRLPSDAVPGSHCFAVEVDVADFEPAYSPGHLLIASLNEPLKRGDRVMLRLRSGGLHLLRFLRQGTRRIDFAPLAGEGPQLTLPPGDVQMMARILWASQ